MKLFKRTALFLLLVAVSAAAYYGWQNRPVPEFGRKVLVFSRTTEYRHEAIPTGVDTLVELGRREQFNVVHTEDPTLFSDANLAGFEAVVFLNTTGDVLDEEQQTAMERYIQAGGGYLGIHAAADTEWREGQWYWYQRLVGGVFTSHPNNSDQVAVLQRKEDLPVAAELPGQFTLSDEWYDFQRLSEGVNILYSVDETSYEGGQMGASHPIAWYRDFDGGRSFYLGMGHTESTYRNEDFLELLRAGMDYAMGAVSQLEYSRSRPEPWRYSRQVLDSYLDEPLKLAFSPDGELYFVERGGALRRYDASKKESVTVHTFEVFSEHEYGLLGLAFDPDFSNNRWLYIYRTLSEGEGGRSYLSRFRLVDGELDETSEEVFFSFPVDGRGEHNAAHTGGDMQFDAQGNLWFSTGDDTAAGDQGHIDDRPGQIYRDAARTAANTQDFRGKILRIKPLPEAGYTIPEGNLFTDPGDGLQEIYAMGVRNPYTIAYDDRSGLLYWGEVGPDGKVPTDRGPYGFDEINRADRPGNYGWPYVIANNLPYSYFDYATDTVGEQVDTMAPENRSRNNTGLTTLPPAIPAWMYYPYGDSERFWELQSGGRNALVAPIFYSDDYADSPVKFPAFMDGKLVISDFVRRWTLIVSTDDAGRVETITPLISDPLSAPLDLTFGPDGALYVVEYGTNWFTANVDSYISRIEFYSGDNPPPVAIASAGKDVGAAPFEAVLDASASYDRGADTSPLSYRWELLEQGKPVAQLGQEMHQAVRFEEPGNYTVQLTAIDGEGAQGTALLHLRVGNERPEVTLTVEGNRSFFFGDDSALEYSAAVTDLEDGSLADGSIDPADVSVVFDYIGQSEDLARALAAAQTDPVLAGRSLATRGSDCHACHTIDSASVGPSFTAIAQRYSERDDAAQYLSQAIAQGSGGQWGEGHSMPAHPGLGEAQLTQLVTFIQSLGGDTAGETDAAATAGRVVFDQHLDDFTEARIDQVVEVDLGRFYPGSYILHASYTDRGTASAEALQGSDTLVLRNSRLSATAFDTFEGMQTFEVHPGVSVAIFANPSEETPFVWGRISAIDLTAIERIEVYAGAFKPMFGGGSLELRLDNPDSEPVASIAIEASFSVDTDQYKRIIDVSDIDGVHDLYFGVSNDHPAGQMAVSLISMEFLPE